MGQFHQPFGAYHKCASAHYLRHSVSRKNYAQLDQNTQQELTNNFYTLHSMPGMSKWRTLCLFCVARLRIFIMQQFNNLDYFLYFSLRYCIKSPIFNTKNIVGQYKVIFNL